MDFYDSCKNGNLETLKYLVEEEGLYPDNGATRLASENGHLDVVKYLVSIGCDPKADDNYAIRWASNNGHLEIVKYLAEEVGCDPTTKNNWGIRWACYFGHLEVVKYLCELGCNPKAKNNYAIRWASENGHLEVLKYLLELGCDRKSIKIEYKYDVLQDVKIRLMTFMHTIPNNYYLKMEILKKIIPSFTEHQIISVLSLA